MIAKLLKMQLLEDDDELAYTPGAAKTDETKKEADGRPAWMRLLSNSLQAWSLMMPKVFTHPSTTSHNISYILSVLVVVVVVTSLSIVLT